MKTDEEIAEEIADKLVEKGCVAIEENRARQDIRYAFRKGAEFGYNKANEWHYNGVPENENDVLCQIDKDIFVVGYFHQKNKQYYTTSGEWLETVVAWKEIILPEEIEK